MKTRLQQPLSALTAFAILWNLSAPATAFAVFQPAARPTASKPTRPAPVKPAPSGPKATPINPAVLRAMIIHNNFGVMEQLNLIHQAKDTVDIARGKLLPSLNLGAIISGITSGPAFALSAISFLLPFLLPSNWANLHQSEDLLESQKIGFRLMELNNYASAYALYQTMLSDMAIREVLVTEYNDLVYIRDYISSNMGANQADVENADAQVQLAAANISNTDETLVRERAALREMLALGLTNDIVLADTHVPASAGETISLPVLVNKVEGAAPENAQMAYMIKAAQEARWSKVFGFMTGASLTVGTSGGAPSFNNLSGGLNFSIGFDYVPTINLASDNVANLQIHERELLAQELQLTEATQGSINEAKKQAADAAKAESELIAYAQDQFQQYTLGHTDVLHVFEAEKTAMQATAMKVKAQLDLDQLRITLHRELLTDQFASIPGCVIRPDAEQQDKDWLGHIFNPSKYNLSIDQACMPAN